MNRETPVEPYVFSKLLAIWVVIIVTIIATALFVGGQVYWWQKSVAKKEQKQLQQKIIDLQNEVKVLKNNNFNVPKTVQQKSTNLKTSKSAKDQKSFKDQLAGIEKLAITLLQNGDLERLAKYINPEKGLRFSPFAYVDLKKDLVFSCTQINNFFRSHHQYTWGYNEENGLPIRLSSTDFYKMYVYDSPYADTNEISYYQNSSPEFNTSNCFEVYPHAIIVEYRVNEVNSRDNPNTNWRSIRLVFEKEGKGWYLVGIIHDQWIL
jgi:hypothetical protein